MKIEKTYLDVLRFNSACRIYLEENGYVINGSFTKKEPTKFVTCLKNVIKQIIPLLNEYNEEIIFIKEQNCATDPTTKVMLMEENGNYKFTAEGSRKCRKEIKDFEKNKVTIHLRLCDNIPELNELEQECFSGFVIPEKEVVSE